MQRNYSKRAHNATNSRLSSNVISRDHSPKSRMSAENRSKMEERCKNKAREILKTKINDVSTSMRTKYRNILDFQKSQFIKKLKQQGTEEVHDRPSMSRELIKREMENYSQLWKSKENNVKRNIS